MFVTQDMIYLYSQCSLLCQMSLRKGFMNWYHYNMRGGDQTIFFRFKCSTFTHFTTTSIKFKFSTGSSINWQFISQFIQCILREDNIVKEWHVTWNWLVNTLFNSKSVLWRLNLFNRVRLRTFKKKTPHITNCFFFCSLECYNEVCKKQIICINYIMTWN